MNQKVVLLLLSLFFVGNSFAQEGKLDPYGRDLKALTLNKRGPNQDKYSHLFLSYGFKSVFDADSSDIIYGKSAAFSIGYLFKWRIAKWSELGFDVAYHRSGYHLKQDSTKIIPNSQLHKREKFIFNSLQASPFIRIKLINKFRSNGTFIDLGGFGGWQYNVKHETIEKNLTPGAGKTKTVNTGLNYKQDYVYGLLARVGFNRFVFYGRYRLSNLFTDKSGLNDLPKYEIGLKLGIHQ
ncbi:MAG: hypothetical protein JKY48_17545 [Flavobacteriales bacterium]|nr:hypothetical protein [Flavobacteriales bacterium]